jgi:hypothetical protein
MISRVGDSHVDDKRLLEERLKDGLRVLAFLIRKKILGIEKTAIENGNQCRSFLLGSETERVGSEGEKTQYSTLSENETRRSRVFSSALVGKK